MKTVTSLQVGLFGFLFHVGAAALLAARAAGDLGAVLRAMAGPAAAAAGSAFTVYALLVTPYARKRLSSQRWGVALVDFLVGMLAEVAIVALAAFVVAVPRAAGALGHGAGAFLVQLAQEAAFGFLWVVATAMTEVLVVGNAAGFTGWFVLKKIHGRA